MNPFLKVIQLHKNQSALIKSALKNNRDAQRVLYELYSPKMLSVCRYYIKDEQHAEEAMLNGFFKVFSKLGDFKAEGSFEGWMKRVTVNTVLQKYRKQRTFEIVDEGQLEDGEEEVSVETDEIPLDFLLKIVQELPDRYRLVFSMYVMDGYQHKEIAEMLGISDGTSKSNLARARMILKNKIEAYNARNEHS